MKRYNIILWITIVLISVKYLPSADSFQCFECENCPTIGKGAKDFIKECAPLDSFSTQEPEYSTNFVASTKNEGNMISSEAAQNSTLSSTSIGLGINSTNASSSSMASSTSTLSSLTSLNKTETATTKLGDVATTTKSSVESSTEKPKVTSSWSMFPNSIEENELNNLKPELVDRSDELFRWKSRQASGICYVLKLNYNGHKITKRGCGLRGQSNQTCQILENGEPNSQCEVCEGNLCNSGSTFKSRTIGFLVILFVLKAYI